MPTLSRLAPGNESAISGIADVNLLRCANGLLLRAQSPRPLSPRSTDLAEFGEGDQPPLNIHLSTANRTVPTVPLRVGHGTVRPLRGPSGQVP